MTVKFDLTNVNNMAFYNSGPKLLFETTEISTLPNSTQQESNYIYLYTTKFGTSIKIRLNRKFKSTEFKTMRVNCISWLSVLLEEETGEPGENHRPAISHWQTLSHNVVSSTPRHQWDFATKCWLLFWRQVSSILDTCVFMMR